MVEYDAENITVHLIPYNPHEGAPFARPSDEAVERFRRLLLERGVEKVMVRRPRGDRILAACGQLALSSQGASKGKRQERR